MSHERNLDYLNKRRIVYRRAPINDKPSEVYQWGGYYENGTYECYELFRSKAKITTYKSLKWHMLVLWYLNPQLDQDAFEHMFKYICYKRNGFVTFKVPDQLLSTMVYEVSMCDLEKLGYTFGVRVCVEGAGNLDGIWTVQDRMNKRFKNRIDFLVNKELKGGKWNNIKISIEKGL